MPQSASPEMIQQNESNIPKWETVTYLPEKVFADFPISYGQTMDMESMSCSDGRKKIAIGIGYENYIDINSKEEFDYFMAQLRKVGEVFD